MRGGQYTSKTKANLIRRKQRRSQGSEIIRQGWKPLFFRREQELSGLGSLNVEDLGVLSEERSGLPLLPIRAFCLLSLTPLLGNDFKYPDLINYKRKRIPWVNAHGGRSTLR